MVRNGLSPLGPDGRQQKAYREPEEWAGERFQKQKERRVGSGQRSLLLFMSSRKEIFTQAPDCWVLRNVGKETVQKPFC